MSRRDPLGHICEHVVRVHIRALYHTQSNVLEAIRNAQRVYGQNQIYFEAASMQSVQIAAADADKFNIVNTECSYKADSREHEALFSRFGARDLRGITAFFTRAILSSDGASRGCAAFPPFQPSVLISAKSGPWTLAHEVGHVLLGPQWWPTHTEEPDNLMYMFSYQFNQGSEPKLDFAQVNQMRRSPYVSRC